MTIHLTVGRHALPAEGLCAMELTALLAGEQQRDHPRCASQILAAYVRHLNDNMPDNERQRLVAFAPRLIGTAAPDDVELERSEFLAWKALRVFAPAALRASSRSKRRAATARVLERQTDLRKATEKAARVRDALPRQADGEWSPAAFAVHRALEASRVAYLRERTLAGDLSDMAAHAAAGAAFQAHRAGYEDAWSLALQALDESLNIDTR
ncbi:hypothetical protein [Shinella sp.]|uniref:hypothetical protein n=1 Tax=Shinella sp. TaxID=1870904 RepID=UPI003F712EAF